LVNAVTQAPGLARAVTWAAGVEPRRPVPRFAATTFQQWFHRREPGGDGSRGEVLLWPDTFTNHFHPYVGQAAVEVIEAAGWRVRMPERALCCGLTWISTGQLDVARRVLARSIAALAGHVRAGGLVVGLEPSCTAVFRADMADLFPDDHDALRLRDHTVTLAELLRDRSDGWAPPRLDRTVLAQAHCHHHAVMGYETDLALLREMGAVAERLESGCCGLAGNFGFTPGHFEVSRDCAEQVLLPRIRAADNAAVVLADGFSCRTQIEQLDSGGREALHLAELLRAALRHDSDVAGAPERTWGPRPAPPSLPARALALAGAGGAAAAATAALARAARR
jgi:Fe-S oxidoreductase